MKRLLLKLMFFLLPIFAVIVAVPLIIPNDFFYFRVWESLVVVQPFYVLRGPFYPNATSSRSEKGDLAHSTPFAVAKQTTWVTDQYGYRKENSSHQNRVVIIGDSNIAGSGLSQNELLSEVLQRRLSTGVYPLAPSSVVGFLTDPRFLKEPPEVVILAYTERSVKRFETTAIPPRPHLSSATHRAKGWVREVELLQTTAVLMDRLLMKRPFVAYTQARLRETVNRQSSPFVRGKDYSPGKPMFFFEGPKANEVVSLQQLHAVVRTFKTWRDALADRGIQTYFLPIPNKETIYHNYLPDSREPTFLGELYLATQGDLKIIDVNTPFTHAAQQGKLLYHLDDSHWNAEGVLMAADLVEVAVSAVLTDRTKRSYTTK